MKQNTITTFMGLCIGISLYLVLFMSVDPKGDWGVSFTLTCVCVTIWAFAKKWGDEEQIDEDS